jgi:hypothetical protein
MDFILDTEESLGVLEDYVNLPTFLAIIPNNDLYHPRINGVSSIYLAFKGSNDSYIIPINHTEGVNQNLEIVLNYLKKYKYLFSLSKKEVLYYLGNLKVNDISLIAILLEGSKIELNPATPTIDYFYRINTDYYPINSLIPLSKLHEKWQFIFRSISRYLKIKLPTYFDFYNEKAMKVYYALEYYGVRVDCGFSKYYQDVEEKYNILDGYAYCWYNPYTYTTRPSNAFNKINFAAINKVSGVRNHIIARNDYLVEFDYDGSHLRLVCQEMGYNLTKEPAHMQLAKLYFPDREITPELYDRSKKITFGALYGDIPSKYENLDFFLKFKKYLDQLEQSYKTKGYIKDSHTGRPIYIESEDYSVAKLMNYNIQSIEASRNITVLENLIKYLNKKKSKVVLYTYDSFLIDFSKEDKKECLDEIQRILSQDGKYLVKFKYGKNLNF